MNGESYRVKRSGGYAASQAPDYPDKEYAAPSTLSLPAPVTSPPCLIYCRQWYTNPPPQWPDFLGLLKKSTPLNVGEKRVFNVVESREIMLTHGKKVQHLR